MRRPCIADGNLDFRIRETEDMARVFDIDLDQPKMQALRMSWDYLQRPEAGEYHT
uniref:Uncharacterized protein n=1 Tax=Canis lupus familiaris TaxID=9615 RepID=A0A8I3P480_CANLF